MITHPQVVQLRDEASAAYDLDMVRICNDALIQGTSSDAWAECERVIQQAADEAQDMNAIPGITMSSPARNDIPEG